MFDFFIFSEINTNKYELWQNLYSTNLKQQQQLDIKEIIPADKKLSLPWNALKMTAFCPTGSVQASSGKTRQRKQEASFSAFELQPM